MARNTHMWAYSNLTAEEKHAYHLAHERKIKDSHDRVARGVGNFIDHYIVTLKKLEKIYDRPSGL